MFPGLTTKCSEEILASAASISPKADIVRLTGTTTIATIVPTFGGGFGGVLFIVPTGGNVQTTTTGNIMNAVTMVDEQVCVLVYIKSEAKWHAGAIS